MNAGQKADAAAVLERARQRAIARAEQAETRLAEVEAELEEAIRLESRAVADTHGERARAEAAETALRKAEEWIQERDHDDDCPAFSRAEPSRCNCGRTAILKRACTTKQGARWVT